MSAATRNDGHLQLLGHVKHKYPMAKPFSPVKFKSGLEPAVKYTSVSIWSGDMLDEGLHQRISAVDAGKAQAGNVWGPFGGTPLCKNKELNL